MAGPLQLSAGINQRRRVNRCGFGFVFAWGVGLSPQNPGQNAPLELRTQSARGTGRLVLRRSTAKY
jgi:hypothetical protein